MPGCRSSDALVRTSAFPDNILWISLFQSLPVSFAFDKLILSLFLTLDAPEDMEVCEKFGLSAYRQHVVLRITQEAREQNALLTIKDLVKLLKSSYSTIKRDVKALREKGFYVPIRGVVRDIGPSSHKSKIVELYVRGHTPSEIETLTWHSLKSVERYVRDFSRVSILTERGESIDNVRLIVGNSLASGEGIPGALQKIQRR